MSLKHRFVPNSQGYSLGTHLIDSIYKEKFMYTAESIYLFIFLNQLVCLIIFLFVHSHGTGTSLFFAKLNVVHGSEKDIVLKTSMYGLKAKESGRIQNELKREVIEFFFLISLQNKIIK